MTTLCHLFSPHLFFFFCAVGTHSSTDTMFVCSHGNALLSSGVCARSCHLCSCTCMDCVSVLSCEVICICCLCPSLVFLPVFLVPCHFVLFAFLFGSCCLSLFPLCLLPVLLSGFSFMLLMLSFCFFLPSVLHLGSLFEKT